MFTLSHFGTKWGVTGKITWAGDILPGLGMGLHLRTSKAQRVMFDNWRELQYSPWLCWYWQPQHSGSSWGRLGHLLRPAWKRGPSSPLHCCQVNCSVPPGQHTQWRDWSWTAYYSIFSLPFSICACVQSKTHVLEGVEGKPKLRREKPLEQPEGCSKRKKGILK